MARRLVECIPNFSEGRRIEVIDAIAAAIGAVQGAAILDRHSDADHNRSVITFVGTPEAVVEAAFAGLRRASQLIDMEMQQGEHPRIGAADVVPFVPIEGVTMDECIALARTLGERVGRELQIPVYLYEAAATRPERQNLANVRLGEYEGLKVAILNDPDREPDFGPSQLGKAGAVAVGARALLIAFNVYLTTDDIEIAKKIALAVRQSGGGLAYVKALGLLVKGRAQVSMNLTDYTQTPIHQAVELIRREAARYGVAVHHSELVGLIPQAALVDAARWYLQLDEFSPDQILETRLEDAFRQETD
jgi:glutamate formiminotransferase